MFLGEQKMRIPAYLAIILTLTIVAPLQAAVAVACGSNSR